MRGQCADFMSYQHRFHHMYVRTVSRQGQPVGFVRAVENKTARAGRAGRAKMLD